MTHIAGETCYHSEKISFDWAGVNQHSVLLWECDQDVGSYWTATRISHISLDRPLKMIMFRFARHSAEEEQECKPRRGGAGLQPFPEDHALPKESEFGFASRQSLVSRGT